MHLMWMGESLRLGYCMLAAARLPCWRNTLISTAGYSRWPWLYGHFPTGLLYRSQPLDQILYNQSALHKSKFVWSMQNQTNFVPCLASFTSKITARMLHKFLVWVVKFSVHVFIKMLNKYVSNREYTMEENPLKKKKNIKENIVSLQLSPKCFSAFGIVFCAGIKQMLNCLGETRNTF